MELGYTDEELAQQGIDEASLACRFLDESDGQWKAITSQVDAANNKVTCQADHFTQFALTGTGTQAPPTQQIFLPMITKN
jgi:hypothetical protein